MTSNLPLIRLSSINPFLLELKRRGVDPSPLLADLGLSADVPASSDLFVAPLSVYALVEQSAKLANDPCFGFAVGEALDLGAWEPISAAVDQASSVGELLHMFSVFAAEHSTATTFYLNTEGERSTFGLRRVITPDFTPGQNDAFYTGFMLRLLKAATGARWDPSRVLFRVADPECIPPGNESWRLSRGDRAGVQIKLPSRWLFERFERTTFQATIQPDSTGDIPRSLVHAVRMALGPHIEDPGLSADRAARICGYERRRLSRELRAQGTTLSAEIRKLRTERATRELVSTDRQVAAIAQTVGFADPTVFSRAFKNWTGLSPQNYRRTHRASD